MSRTAIAQIAKLGEQREATFLRERFAAGDADVPRGIRADLGDDIGNRAPLAAVERIFRVAPYTAQRTTGQAYENRRPADRVCLALHGMEYFADAKPVFGVRSRRGICRGVFARGQ